MIQKTGGRVSASQHRAIGVPFFLQDGVLLLLKILSLKLVSHCVIISTLYGGNKAQFLLHCD